MVQISNVPFPCSRFLAVAHKETVESLVPKVRLGLQGLLVPKVPEGFKEKLAPRVLVASRAKKVTRATRATRVTKETLETI